MAQIDVYTQPGCAPCNEVKLWLHDHGFAFTEYNIRRDPASLQKLVTSGFQATPVTFVDGEATAGYNPSELRRMLGVT